MPSAQRTPFIWNAQRPMAICLAGLGLLANAPSAAAQSQVIHGKRAAAKQHRVVNFAQMAQQEKLHPRPAQKRAHPEPKTPKPLPVPPTAVAPFKAAAPMLAAEIPRPLSPPLTTNFAGAPDNLNDIPPDTQGAV